MSLRVYRRHRTTCELSNRSVRRRLLSLNGDGKKTQQILKNLKDLSSCRCSLWCKGFVEGRFVRESLKTRSQERAEQLVRQREANLAPAPSAVSTTVDFAIQKYFEDCEARRLAGGTLRKYRTFRSVLTKFAEKKGIITLNSFGPQQVRDFMGQRKLGPMSAAKEIERVRTFFTFCVENEWLAKNPASVVKPPKVRTLPRTPFAEQEVQTILAKAENDRELAFVLTLRHTGLRIGDASLLKTSHVTGNRVHLYTTKSGTPVSVVIPPNLASLLRTLPTTGGYLFLIGESIHPHTTSNLWRRRIKRMCKDAEVTPGHPHRFRHTLAADLLSKGASIEDVAAILGNSPGVVQKHYSQWIKSRQDRLDAIVSGTWAKA